MVISVLLTNEQALPLHPLPNPLQNQIFVYILYCLPTKNEVTKIYIFSLNKLHKSPLKIQKSVRFARVSSRVARSRNVVRFKYLGC